MARQKSTFRKVERGLRYQMSCFLSMMFSPGHTRSFKWYEIIGIMAMVFGLGYLASR